MEGPSLEQSRLELPFGKNPKNERVVRKDFIVLLNHVMKIANIQSWNVPGALHSRKGLRRMFPLGIISRMDLYAGQSESSARLRKRSRLLRKQEITIPI
ncbi:hypothetical protein Tco_1568034 [Tanacetum coccineum]